jgi:hypothetical protein
MSAYDITLAVVNFAFFSAIGVFGGIATIALIRCFKKDF